MAPPSPDKNELVQCPYDPVHRILKFKLNTHLTKCRKNFPRSNRVTCKYNANHVIPGPEKQHHEASCLERFRFELPPSEEEKMVADRYPIPKIEVSTDECWDDYDVPTYNPLDYCARNDVLTRLDVEPAAVKKQFRLAERKRINDIEYNQRFKENIASTNRPLREIQPLTSTTRLDDVRPPLTSTSRAAEKKPPGNHLSAKINGPHTATNPRRSEDKGQTNTSKHVVGNQLCASTGSPAEENQPPSSVSSPKMDLSEGPGGSDDKTGFILVKKKPRRKETHAQKSSEYQPKKFLQSPRKKKAFAPHQG